MVADRLHEWKAVPTGAKRLRLYRGWLFPRVICEHEYTVEYRRFPPRPGSSTPPDSVSREWRRESAWNVLGQDFYLNGQSAGVSHDEVPKIVLKTVREANARRPRLD